MIISRIEREAVHDAYLTIGGLTFPRDIPALCYQLGDALAIVRSPSVSDVEASLAQLEAAVDGLDAARERIQEAADDLRGRWSGEAADSGRTAFAELDGELEAMARGIRDEIAVAAADLRKTAADAAATVDSARLRMIRAFSLTPQLRSHLDGEARTARFAALFSLIKTEARQGLSHVTDAYQDFDQASYRFIDAARHAERAIQGDRHDRVGRFLA
jgi:hypothetical protein